MERSRMISLSQMSWLWDPCVTHRERGESTTAVINWALPVFQAPYYVLYTHFRGEENSLGEVKYLAQLIRAESGLEQRITGSQSTWFLNCCPILPPKGASSLLRTSTAEMGGKVEGVNPLEASLQTFHFLLPPLSGCQQRSLPICLFYLKPTSASFA